MTVVVIEAGKVVLTLRDVTTVKAARKKYPHLEKAMVVAGDHPENTPFSNGRFTKLPVPTPQPKPIPRMEKALLALAATISPEAMVAVRAELDP